MKEIPKTDNKERNLELVFKRLRSLSTKAGTVLVDSMSGKEAGYTKKQIFTAKCILEIVDPQRLMTPLGISDSAFDLL
jgi:uncharacterized protein YpbB